MMTMKKHFLLVVLWCITTLLPALGRDICENDPLMLNATSKLAILGVYENLVSDCGKLQSFMGHLELTWDPDVMELIQLVVGPLCGCPRQEGEGDVCRLCGGNDTSIPENNTALPVSVHQNETDILGPLWVKLIDYGIMPSCQLIDGYAQSISAANPTCGKLRETFGSRCGCDGQVTNTTAVVVSTNTREKEGMCQYCRNDGDDENFSPDVLLPYTKNLWKLPEVITCRQEAAYVENHLEESSNQCYYADLLSYLCGCNNSLRNNFGADTKLKHILMAWIPRVTGLLSLIGSCLIIRDVAKNKKLRKSTLHQLVGSMSVFDAFGSLAFILSTLPIPVEQFGSPTGVYGAMGNEHTCRAQGFFVQLGYTGALYNMVLSIYYLLIIRFGMSETQVRRYKVWFHVPVLIVGFGLAFAGIPFYDNIEFFCHIQLPFKIETAKGFVSISNATDETPVNIFSLIPISMVMIVGGVNMIIIYYHVKKQDKAANKWRFTARDSTRSTNAAAEEVAAAVQEGGRRASFAKSKDFMRGSMPRVSFSASRDARSTRRIQNRLTDSVFWQAIFYMGTFFLCWPIYYVSIFNRYHVWRNYGFWIALLILYPLQGFLNAIVYFRRRMLVCFKKELAERSSRRGEASTQSVGRNPSRSFIRKDRESRESSCHLESEAP